MSETLKFNPQAPHCPVWPPYLSVEAVSHGWRCYDVEILIYREGSSLRGPFRLMVNPNHIGLMKIQSDLRVLPAEGW